MVEIKRTLEEEDSPPVFQDELDAKYRLLYTKSKVYVNPSSYSRDNIPGFIALVKRVRQVSHDSTSRVNVLFQEAVNPLYLLAWIPETLLNEKGPNEWDKFVHIEEKTFFDQQDEEEGPCTSISSTYNDHNPPLKMPFSLTCQRLVRKPTLSLFP